MKTFYFFLLLISTITLSTLFYFSSKSEYNIHKVTHSSKFLQSPQRKLEVNFASSIQTCSRANSKLFSYYSTSADVTFDEHISNCGCQAIINLVTNNGEDKDNIMDYIERIGPYFFFYALAVVLLIVWIFYCSCCCCPSCCCVQKIGRAHV